MLYLEKVNIKNKTMEDFKTRLILEHTELNEKIEKLDTFTKSDKFTLIDNVQMTLLNIQLCAMQTYSQCLVERIARL